MTRARSPVPKLAKRKKILALAKGFRGRANNCYTIALQKVEKALQYAYRDRRKRKGDMRALWIQRINAGARISGLVYSKFISGLKKAGIEINRKMLSELAIHEPAAFAALAEKAKKALSA
jgi:large subunit ribosomal protein L20